MSMSLNLGVTFPSALESESPVTQPPPSGYARPPVTHGRDGQERRVGLEVEFAGLDAEQTLAGICDVLGGVQEQLGRNHGRVSGTPFGDFGVELDSTLFRERAYVEALKNVGVDLDADAGLGRAEDLVVRVVREFVPFEVVTPPVAWSRLGELEPLWRRLRELGARGTHAAWRYGFGLHINPDVPSTNARSLLAHLKAFLLLQPWLVKEGRTSLTRRLGPFIRPFPPEYLELVLAPEYWPEQRGFVDDYLVHNPTRDRPLDLLPVFAHLDRALIDGRVENPQLVKARPAFHYRLPNCDIDRIEWSPSLEWNRWLCVERLAHDAAALQQLCQRYVDCQAQRGLVDAWPDELEAWMQSCPPYTPNGR
ncbi:MAG TPA: amidoligase family protein [Polyangiaceae bacterium]|nr:amidoligase family protein [Polyangiaceae bacterium]